MKTLSRRRLRCLAGLGCLAFLSLAWGQEPGARLTPELIQNRIVAAQDCTELDDSTKARLVEEYRKAISNLETRNVPCFWLDKGFAHGCNETGSLDVLRVESARVESSSALPRLHTEDLLKQGDT